MPFLATCDVADHLPNESTGTLERYVCINCPDMDLCIPCMEKYIRVANSFGALNANSFVLSGNHWNVSHQIDRYTEELVVWLKPYHLISLESRYFRVAGVAGVEGRPSELAT
ncbi:hypothetical protein BDV11DRAFT_189665 [Aspergillus similis]